MKSRSTSVRRGTSISSYFCCFTGACLIHEQSAGSGEINLVWFGKKRRLTFAPVVLEMKLLVNSVDFGNCKINLV